MPFGTPGGGLCDYAYITGNALGVRPAAAVGATITPGANNSYGSYAQVLTAAQVGKDLFGLTINFNTGFVATAARDTIATVGVDPAGGSTYVDLIPHLLCSGAGGYISAGGVNYFFPIWIKAGSSVAVKASVNNATAGTIRCVMLGFGDPSDTRNVRVGSRVEAVGVVTASSRGTLVTSGTTSEGAWTALGALANAAWWFQLGMGVNDSTMAALGYNADLAAGDASNKHLLLQDVNVITTNSESVAVQPHAHANARYVAASQNLYGRLQCSGTADSNPSLAGYALS